MSIDYKDLIIRLKNTRDEITSILEELGAENLSPEEQGVVDDILGKDAEVDTLSHLRALEELVGKHEVDDKKLLMDRFNKYGITDYRGEVFDPSVNPWCGAGLRYAICEAGLADPGLNYNKASAWANYGEECDPSEAGAILVHHTHVGIRTEDGGEIGCNVTNSVKVGQDNWFGEIIAARKPLYF